MNEEISKEEVVSKLATLDRAKDTLLKEFVGIDPVIEELIESVRTWFALPQIQERPLVVNLWGMTGTGKTSLVRRLSQLIQMENAFFPLDMGNSNDSRDSFYHTLDEVFEHNSGRPFIILFDEFQHARSIQGGEDRIVGKMGNVWKLLDTGMLEIQYFSRSLSILKQRIKLLRTCLSRGIIVKNGHVAKKLDLFCQITDERLEDGNYSSVNSRKPTRRRRHKAYEEKDDRRMPFFPSYEWDDLLELSKGKFSSEYEISEVLGKFDGPGTIVFLEKILEDAKKPNVLDCSKSLIIVAGNLDEAYQMAGNKNPDIPADVWKELTKDISLNHIKDALSVRFRSEHIARLGNNHIIYPAMGEKEFKKFIHLRTESIAHTFEQNHGISLKLSRSILRIIFQEGVYPTQGFRPVNTTIDRFIQNNLSEILGHTIIDFPNTTRVLASFKNNKLVFSYFSNDKLLGERSKKVRLDLQNKRVPMKNNNHALTSVHEAGHVVCSSILLQDIPAIAVSATSATDAGGFVIRTGKNQLIQKEQLLRLIAFNLGGYVAEKLVFGEENLTTGSSSDIFQSSAFTKGILESCGFEIGPAAFEHNRTPLTAGVIDHAGELDTLVLKYLKEGEELAKRTIETERNLLMRIAEALFKKGALRKKELEKLVKQYSSSNPASKGVKFPFKDHFLRKLEQIDSLQKVA